MVAATTDRQLLGAYARRLRSRGHRVTQVHRVFPPADPGGLAEILFRGARSDGGAVRCLTAFMSDTDEDVIVVDGW